MGLELKLVTRVVGRWWWLIVIAIALGALSGRSLAARTPTLYAATAQVIVNPKAGNSSIDYGTIQGVQDLAATYQQLITTWPVLEPVVEELGPPYTVEMLQKQVTTAVVPSTLLIHITVSDQDAKRSAALANRVADSFLNYITLQTVSVNVDVALAVPAQTPSDPYAPKTPLYIALGGLIGLLCAIAAVSLFECRDDSIRSSLEAAATSGRPILGVVPYNGKLRRNGPTYAPYLSSPGDSFAESFRSLRSRVIRSTNPEGHLRLLVASANAADGKSTVSSNLGVALAQTGLSVLIVDANFRKPSLHQRFSVTNDRGLSTLLINPTATLSQVSAQINVPNLSLITSGPQADRAINLLDSPRLLQIVQEMDAAFDVVIVDSPQMDASSDAISLASFCDGSILVCRIGSTKARDLANASQSLSEAGTSVFGVVLNQERRTRLGIPGSPLKNRRNRSDAAGLLPVKSSSLLRSRQSSAINLESQP